MFFGTSEIESTDGNLVTLKNGDVIEITDKNKELFTESATTGSELQEAMIRQAAEDVKNAIALNEVKEEQGKRIIDTFAKHNIRLVDISTVWDVIFSEILETKAIVDTTIEAKNNETIVNALGKEKLDAFSRIFGATENAPNNSVRNIRMKDIFNT